MAVITKTFACSKDAMARQKYGGNGVNSGNGLDQHLVIGRHVDSGDAYYHRAYLAFTLDWSDVGQIVSAELVLTTTTQVHVSFGTKPECAVARLTQAFSEFNAGEGVWDPAEYQRPTPTSVGGVNAVVPKTQSTAWRINITDIIEAWAPTTVQKRDGSQGGVQPNNGILLQARSESDLTMVTEFYSRQFGTAGSRPHIDLTYEKTNTKPDKPYNPTLVPQGNVTSAPTFQGDFSDPDSGDFMSQSHVQVIARSTTGPVIWETYQQASGSEKAANRFSVPLPALIKSGVEYEWRARVADSKGLWSDFSSATPPYDWFMVTNNAPTCVLKALGSYASLSAVHFKGTFSDPDTADTLGSYRIQFRPQTAPGAAAWNQTDHLWDTGVLTASVNETASKQFDRTYGGAPLAAGTYTWRAQVADNWGSWSPWVYDDLVLTAAWNPDPGNIDFLTNYSPKKSPARVVIRGMEVTLSNLLRGPAISLTDTSQFAAPLAIIEDATNLGASKYLNAPGEFYMTLPATHPQISVIEPYKVHYAVELYNGDRWRECFAGLITDFDATADDVVFYGTDYLGLLSLSVDDRFDKAKGPDTPYTQGGSKYIDVTISTVILDQLAMARAQTDSPVAFISNGAMDVFSEHVTILSTFKQRLPFISGLLDSHRQGTGKRSRLEVRRKSTTAAYEYVLTDDPGEDRLNLKMEYGGLVQGFHLSAFGDFGTYVHGLGRTPTGTNLMYKTEAAPGILPATYGRIAKVNVWTDLIDENDLVRRTKQAAAVAGRVGKRIAMAIRTDAVQPFDGYDIGDSIPVHIKRGAVDTTRYGSGLWSVMGVEMTLAPDGHLDNTFVVLPKEDGVAPDPDLIPSAPILSDQAQWETDIGAPIDGVNVGEFYLDSYTGMVYQNVGGHWVRIGMHADTIADGSVSTPSIIPTGIDAGTITSGTLGAPASVDATAIDEGALPGGHNNILNSSFEMTDFAVAGVNTTWDVAGDWTATRVGSDTNITTAGSLTQTGMTY